MDGITDLEILRSVLARELETINEYTALARRAQDPAVRSLLLHISRDEEEHVAECIQWISRMNPVMAGFLARSEEHVQQKELELLAAPGPAGVPVAPPPVVPVAVGEPAMVRPSGPPLANAPLGGRLLTRAGLTVGNLLNQPMGKE